MHTDYGLELFWYYLRHSQLLQGAGTRQSGSIVRRVTRPEPFRLRVREGADTERLSFTITKLKKKKLKEIAENYVLEAR